MLDWYVPWANIDGVLKLEFLLWLGCVLSAYWIYWRTVIKKRAWLRRKPSAS